MAYLPTKNFNLGGPCNGSCWYILWPLDPIYGHLVYFVTIWYILWLFGIFFPGVVCCTKKNLATLLAWSMKVCLLSTQLEKPLNGSYKKAVTFAKAFRSTHKELPIVRSSLSNKGSMSWSLIPEIFSIWKRKTDFRFRFQFLESQMSIILSFLPLALLQWSQKSPKYVTTHREILFF
jgi:hypothetical protein